LGQSRLSCLHFAWAGECRPVRPKELRGAVQEKAAVTSEPSQRTVALHRLLKDLDAAHPGAQFTAEAADLFERFTRALLAEQPPGVDAWARILGPVATSTVVAELLGLTRRRLDGARARGAVLGVRTSAGRWVYPLGQFRWGEGPVRVLDGLEEVLRALCVAGEGYGAARWLATANRRLGGATPWEVLHEDRGVDAVIEAARCQGRAWAGR